MVSWRHRSKIFSGEPLTKALYDESKSFLQTTLILYRLELKSNRRIKAFLNFLEFMSGLFTGS
jgi:hypothetical protein